MYYAEQISQELGYPPDDWLVLTRDYSTQSVDTAALEADNSNGWYDVEKQTLHLVIASQSPQEVMESLPQMLAKSDLSVTQVILHPCYTVGYGSKDHYNFPYYGAIASLYGEGKPVRLANDRYEQFQSGLKRHPYAMHYTMGVDKKTGKLQSFKGDMSVNGGGR